jgi:hypothetical protein
MTEWTDGMGVYFHEDCFAHASGEYSIFAS